MGCKLEIGCLDARSGAGWVPALKEQVLDGMVD